MRWHIPCSLSARDLVSAHLRSIQAFAGRESLLVISATHPVIVVCTAIFLITAAVSDYRSRRISNRLNGAAAATGIVLHSLTGGTDGALFALHGFGVGLGVLLLPFAAGMIGGGDVKFAAAAGTFLGWRLLLVGLAAGIILGGVTAAISLARRRRFLSALRGLHSDILCWAGGVSTETLKSTAATETIPYGVLLATGIGGAMLAALFRWVPWASL
jgi:prepilin peptidase CpaA